MGSRTTRYPVLSSNARGQILIIMVNSDGSQRHIYRLPNQSLQNEWSISHLKFLG